MRKAVPLFFIALVAALVGSDARAGWKATKLLTATVTDTTASGTLSQVRASANNVEYLGCETFVSDTPGEAPTVFCQAKNAAGKYLGCTTDNELIARAVATITPFTWLYFEVSNGTCRYVEVMNMSFDAPIQP